MTPLLVSAFPCARRAGIPVALTALLALGGCASPASDRTEVMTLAPGDLVALVPAEAGAAPNDHPVEFDAGTLVRALGSVRVPGERGALLSRTFSSSNDAPALQPVFQQRELEQAAGALRGAFANAGPDQDVALRLNQLEAGDLVGLLKYSRVTAARLFHRNGRLHFILGSLGEDTGDPRRPGGRQVAKASGYGGVEARFSFPDEIGSRQSVSAIDRNLTLPDGAVFVDADRQDWIALELGGAVDAAQPSPAPARRPAPDASQPVPSEPPDRAADAPGGDSAQPGLQPPAPAPAAATPAPAVLSAEEVTRKLEQLRDLKERGLISEPLYREKVRELVDRYLE